MRQTRLLTAGEVATHCRVSYEAVKKWVNTGKLKAHLTPGRHRRIAVEDFRDFLRQYDWPPLPEEVGKRRVLVVDDDPKVVKLLAKCFRKTGGYELATAADGYAAGFEVATFAPEVVLLELLLPGLDGFAVCRQIKASPKTWHIQVLGMTGTPTDEHHLKAVSCGVDGFLGKPFKLAELRKRLDTLYQGTRSTAAHATR
jgi:excisionase family DNA binding protein